MAGDSVLEPESPLAFPNTNRLTNGIDQREITGAIERISKSHAMSGSRRLIQLLTFLVGSTLRGDAEHLKETTIGVAVFGRKPDYDPKVDTIVRSQAWRLRAKLRSYYSSEGAAERIVVEIPTGHYIPVFLAREEMLAE